MEGFLLAGTLLVFATTILTFAGNVFLPFWVKPPQVFFTLPLLLPILQLIPAMLFYKYKYRWPMYALCGLLSIFSTGSLIFGHVGVALDLIDRGLSTNSYWMNIAYFFEAFLLVNAALGQVIVVITMGDLLREAGERVKTKGTWTVRRPRSASLGIIVVLTYLQASIVGISLYLQTPVSAVTFSIWYLWVFAAPYMLDWILVVIWWTTLSWGKIHLYASGLQVITAAVGCAFLWPVVQDSLAGAATTAAVVGAAVLIILSILLLLARLAIGALRWKMEDDGDDGTKVEKN